MAELLVRANPHWMDSFTQTDIDKLSDENRKQYEARTQIGDIIVVKPDGWKWGKEETLPTFIVVKIPELDYDAAKSYEESLRDANHIFIKRRKWNLNKNNYVINAAQLSQSIITINITTFNNITIEKDI